MGFFFFPKELDVNIVINNVTYSPKSSLGYTGITHKVTNDSTGVLIIPLKAGRAIGIFFVKYKGNLYFIEVLNKWYFHCPIDATWSADKEIPHF